MSDVHMGQEFWGDLRQQIARRIRNSSEAEDLLHSAFLKFQQYKLEHEVVDPAAFLVKTACNLNIDNFRRRKKVVEGYDPQSVEDKTPLPDEVVTARQRLGRVQAGLDRLPAKTREIFVMHHGHELKYQEIAERRSISVSSIEKHMAFALLFLSGWMAGW